MRNTRRCLGAVLTVWLFLALGAPSTLADANHREVRIALQALAFQPAEVTVQAGQEVVLRFDNHDVEIHAFVPDQWLEHVPVEVCASGAPFFGDKGSRGCSFRVAGKPRSSLFLESPERTAIDVICRSTRWKATSGWSNRRLRRES